ncbi:glycosyltransferase [Pseudomonas sp. MF4836]|uniref:glycosyltransferase n=1 Tax=Pseudomonas sp. MF4836 TaxID=1960827 RepID=UPI000996A301|nr:glycosyltransferase [Pseudomonas sp. MF4836]OOV94073.1 glycosyl transferase [Pseudomonas sp. MF4836]
MISVVMGVSRFDEFVPLAVDSVLSQTFSDFELIIVANGPSSDEVESCLSELYSSEPRLRVIKSRIPQLACALNIGLDAAKFDYVARMDADDVCWPDRLEKQFAYMQANNLDFVGCDLRLIDPKGAVLGTRIYPKGARIDKMLRYKNCFAHNTIIYRKELIIKAGGYNAGFNSEDYDLWLRLKRFGVKWANMDEVLLDYRIHSGASQRKLLGYAEATGLAAREFVLNKSIKNLLAVLYHFSKSIIRSR